MEETAARLAAAGLLVLLAVGVGRIGSRIGVPALSALPRCRDARRRGRPRRNLVRRSAARPGHRHRRARPDPVRRGPGDRHSVLRRDRGAESVLATLGVAVTDGRGRIGRRSPFSTSTSGPVCCSAASSSSTDAAAVFAVLRSQRARASEQPPRRPRGGVRNERPDGRDRSRSACIELIQHPDRSPIFLVGFFVQEIVIGGAVGIAAGAAALWVLKRVRLDHDGLYPAITIAVAIGDVWRRGGHARKRLPRRVRRGGGAREPAVPASERASSASTTASPGSARSACSSRLGLLVFPSRLPDIAGEALVIAAVLVFLARPLAAALTLLPLRVPWRDAAFVSWVGLRGAVPIVLATFPLVEGIPRGRGALRRRVLRRPRLGPRAGHDDPIRRPTARCDRSVPPGPCPAHRGDRPAR